MEIYHKIPSAFKRDMEGTKKLMEDKFSMEELEYLQDSQWI